MTELRIAAAIILSIALAMGWILALLRTPAAPVILKVVRDPGKFLYTHIDYLMMSLLLFAFAALVDDPSMTLVWLAIAGAFVNPFMLLLFALVPEWNKKQPLWYQALATASFLATTIGFGGLAWGIAL